MTTSPSDIPDAAVEAAAKAMVRISRWEDVHESSKMQLRADARRALEAAAAHMLASGAVSAVLALHREQPCLDDDGDPIGGSYCEECKDLDDHSGERVHEVYPCLTVREITAALAGAQTFTAMRDQIERQAR